MTTPVRVPWKQVPMPDRIAQLPRDKRGFPVPWVSCWTSGEHGVGELTVTTGIFGVSLAGAVCDHIAGEGLPDLANLCSGNQIKGMTERRCDVCGDVIDEGPLHFVGSVDNTSFREPPLHLECAVYSLQVCPGISTAPGVGVVVTGSYEMHPEMMLPDFNGGSVEGIPGVKREIMRGFPEAVAYMQLTQVPGVCMGVHAIPRNPVRILREHFLEEFRDG